MDADAALSYLQGMLTVTTQTEDAAEGVAAFAEKRAPQWKGRWKPSMADERHNWGPLVGDLAERRERALEMGGADRVVRQRELGKLTVRERLDLLLDPGIVGRVRVARRPHGRRVSATATSRPTARSPASARSKAGRSRSRRTTSR